MELEIMIAHLLQRVLILEAVAACEAPETLETVKAILKAVEASQKPTDDILYQALAERAEAAAKA